MTATPNVTDGCVTPFFGVKPWEHLWRTEGTNRNLCWDVHLPNSEHLWLPIPLSPLKQNANFSGVFMKEMVKPCEAHFTSSKTHDVRDSYLPRSREGQGLLGLGTRGAQRSRQFYHSFQWEGEWTFQISLHMTHDDMILILRWFWGEHSFRPISGCLTTAKWRACHCQGILGSTVCFHWWVVADWLSFVMFTCSLHGKSQRRSPKVDWHSSRPKSVMMLVVSTSKHCLSRCSALSINGTEVFVHPSRPFWVQVLVIEVVLTRRPILLQVTAGSQQQDP